MANPAPHNNTPNRGDQQRPQQHTPPRRRTRRRVWDRRNHRWVWQWS
ncbi:MULTISPECIES: hypothetical protein [unclassified Gordonia (in: high G+C Gram-positive bacteria)]|nr:hypothetical protein [Gordonia sp. PP30]UQE76488.1 hypothetical protein MYK68_07950 [Gordonia sp. PP30]